MQNMLAGPRRALRAAMLASTQSWFLTTAILGIGRHGHGLCEEMRTEPWPSTKAGQVLLAASIERG